MLSAPLGHFSTDEFKKTMYKSLTDYYLSSLYRGHSKIKTYKIHLLFSTNQKCIVAMQN